MLKKYTQEDYIELYDSLPEKIQILFWEDDVPNRIEKMAERFNLSSKEEEKITKMAFHLFLGILPPSHIRVTVSSEFSLDEITSEKLSKEILRFIVYPIHHLLKELYDGEDFKGTDVKTEDDSSKNKKDDAYREPIK